MIRTIAFFSLLGSVALLSACSDSKSTEFPAETTHIDGGVSNTTPGEYRGTALDGYLQEAVVWLDMNENGQWDTFTLKVLDEETGTVVEKTFDEPHATTGQGGQFSLDVTNLERDPLAGTDLNPEDYPLMLLAIPGQTYDEGFDQVVDRGFFMMAPPGIKVISPFTTLVEIQRQREFGDEEEAADRVLAERVNRSSLDVRQALGDDFDGSNFMTDYIRSNAELMTVYGEALVALFKSQISDEVNDGLSSGTLEGGGLNVFDTGRLRVIGEIYFSKAESIIDQVNQLVEEQGIDNFSVSQIDVDASEVDESNPLVLVTETFYMNPFTTETGEIDQTRVGEVEVERNKSAVITYDYSAAGQITQVEVNGRTDVRLRELLSLLETEGRVSNMAEQRFPGLYIKESTAELADLEGEEGVTSPTLDERYTFDWDNREITLDAVHEGIDTSGQQVLDGQAEIRFTWTLDSAGRVDSIRQAPLAGSGAHTKELTIFRADDSEPENPDRVVKTELSVDDSFTEARVFNGLNECSLPPNLGEEGRREPDQNEMIDVYSDQAVTNLVTTDVGIYTSRDEVPRLVKALEQFAFNLANGSEGPTEDIVWLYEYHDDSASEDALDPDQPELLSRRSLLERVSSPRNCSSETGFDRTYMGTSTFSYKNLADYLRDSGE